MVSAAERRLVSLGHLLVFHGVPPRMWWFGPCAGHARCACLHAVTVLSGLLPGPSALGPGRGRTPGRPARCHDPVVLRPFGARQGRRHFQVRSAHRTAPAPRAAWPSTTRPAGRGGPFLSPRGRHRLHAIPTRQGTLLADSEARGLCPGAAGSGTGRPPGGPGHALVTGIGAALTPTRRRPGRTVIQPLLSRLLA